MNKLTGNSKEVQLLHRRRLNLLQELVGLSVKIMRELRSVRLDAHQETIPIRMKPVRGFFSLRLNILQNTVRRQMYETLLFGQYLNILQEPVDLRMHLINIRFDQ
jgi:hypothetical protein